MVRHIGDFELHLPFDSESAFSAVDNHARDQHKPITQQSTNSMVSAMCLVAHCIAKYIERPATKPKLQRIHPRQAGPNCAVRVRKACASDGELHIQKNRTGSQMQVGFSTFVARKKTTYGASICSSTKNNRLALLSFRNSGERIR